MTKHEDIDPGEAWARLRFSVVGHLLAAPPGRGELDGAIEELSRKGWRNPITGESVRFSKKTIERWYYAALDAHTDPVRRLRKRRRCDFGEQPSITDSIAELIRRIRRNHPDWTMQLVTDELRATLESRSAADVAPSYSSVRRFMKRQGIHRRQRKNPRREELDRQHSRREVRRFEVDRVNALWHLDFHQGSRRVLTEKGRWAKANLLCILDDHSRIVCHAQWYLSEDTEDLVHGFTQALQRRGLPRSLLNDNGSAMTSAEFRAGLARLGIVLETTLPYHPAQNGKQERFFATIEGRLMALLSGKKDLDLAYLNYATHAWIEQEYHVTEQRDLGMSPRERLLRAKDAGRECPVGEKLRCAFMRDVTRRPKRQTATITVDGVRFEIPIAYRHFERVRVRYASWDLSAAWLVDDRGDAIVRIYPEDTVTNSDARRRLVDEDIHPIDVEPDHCGDDIPALLKRYLADFAADGLPPAYIPKPTTPDEERS